MAGWSAELSEGLLARTLLDEPLVLFRSPDGSAVATLDRCPHRFAPLSRGRVKDGTLECGYHGLRFDGFGRCVHNPHGPITGGLAVKSYPIVELDHIIWVWMGKPEEADPASIPDLAFLSDAPASCFSSGYLRGRGDYQLYTDNILDLTHADYLHADTLGGTFTSTTAKVSETDAGVFVRWHAFDSVPSPMMVTRLPEGVVRADTWTEVDWHAPSVMVLRSGAVPAGRPRAEGRSSLNIHIMTPETAQSTHYFYAATRNYDRTNVALNEQVARLRDRVFATEDAPMIEGQQDRIGNVDFLSLSPALMRIDEGAIRARRALQRLIAAERRRWEGDGEPGTVFCPQRVPVSVIDHRAGE